jgi:Protein of unknown function (DUF3102)
MSKRAARILRSHARHIQQLGRRAVRDVVEIGRRLHDAKRRVGHGKFLCWIATEFGWSDKTAERFMSVHALAEKFDNLSNLELPISALYLLAAPSTPDKAIFQVAARAGVGAGLSFTQVKDVIEQSRRASPLRQRIMIANQRWRIAKQILREVRKLPGSATSSDVCRIFDRHFAALADDDRASVNDNLFYGCTQALAHCRTQIKYLELLQERIAQERAPLFAGLTAINPRSRPRAVASAIRYGVKSKRPGPRARRRQVSVTENKPER